MGQMKSSGISDDSCKPAHTDIKAVSQEPNYLDAAAASVESANKALIVGTAGACGERNLFKIPF